MDFMLLGTMMEKNTAPCNILIYISTCVQSMAIHGGPTTIGVVCEQHMQAYMTYKAKKKDRKRIGKKSHRIGVDVGCAGEVECGEGQRNQEESSGELAPNLKNRIRSPWALSEKSSTKPTTKLIGNGQFIFLLSYATEGKKVIRFYCFKDHG